MAYLPPCKIWFFSKLPNAGESTHWHVITNIVNKWSKHKARVRQLLQNLHQSEDPQQAALYSGIDISVLNRPPALRSPRSVKLFNGVDEGFYRCVAEYTANDGAGAFRLVQDRRTDICGFLATSNTIVRPPYHRAWTYGNRLLPVPDYDDVMPFKYTLSYAKESDIREIVDQWFETRGLDRYEKLEFDDYTDLCNEVVEYLNQFFAHARDGGVFVVCPPQNYSPSWDPDKTILLTRNVYKTYSVDRLTRNFPDFCSWLIPPNKKKVIEVSWLDVWLKSPKKHKYEVAFGYSKPLTLPNQMVDEVPPVFNTWTGPGVSPQEAFDAVRADPVRAREVVEFFVDYLKTVVCGDPFEDPIYNTFAFQFVTHFLIWLLKRPHDTFPAVCYFWSPEQGVGKGQLTNIMTLLVGMHNTYSGTGVNGLSGQYAGYVAEKLLWIMDEEASRAKELEANGMIKRLVTEPLLTGDKKYQDPRTINNAVKLVGTSNQLRPVLLTDRRWFSCAVNAVHRNDTDYWNKYSDYILSNNGHRYIAAWIYGLTPNPGVKPGMVVPKGYLRVRQAEKETNTDPLQAVLMPWFSTSTRAVVTEPVFNFSGEFVDVVEVTHEQFVVDAFSAEYTVSWRRFIDDWFEGSYPSGAHYNQPLFASMTIDKKVLIEECAATKLTKSYTVHNLKRSLSEVFGDKFAPLFSASESHKYTRVFLGTEDKFEELVMTAFCRLIVEAAPNRIGGNEVEDVWPIPVGRLRAFVHHGVTRTANDGFARYTVNNVEGDFARLDPALLLWPQPEETRTLCFNNAGGGRTPVEDISLYPINWAWFRSGFSDIHGHPDSKSAEQYLEEAVLREQQSNQARADREAERRQAEQEFELMMAGE